MEPVMELDKVWSKSVGEDQLWSYNCVDCVRTRESGEALQRAIPAMGLQEVEDFQQSMFWPVLQAMQRGVRIDKVERAWMDKKMETELAKRLAYFEYVLGHKLNVNSNKQMKELFYGDFNLKPIMSRAKKGEVPHITCDDSALATIALKNPLLRPLIHQIQEYRTIRVFLSTFIRMPLDIDDRMRTSYNICGTETYRLSSSENAFDSGGNLQNIPKGGEDDESDLVLPNMRTIFVPDHGFTFFDTDLSKADLRVVIWESDETEMKAMLNEGRDPYIETAREFYSDPTITKRLPNGQDNPKYKTFKSFAHGTHYLGTAVGLSQRLGLTVHQAERTQRWYFGKYPKIKEWQERFCDEIRRTRRVKNAFGYTRVYFDRVSESTCREAIAWLPQSTVACVINRVWKNLYDQAPQIQVLLQVHDSLAGQFPTHRSAECHEDFARLSRIVVPYPDTLIIPIELKTSEKSWGDC
jgi:DNA polymerase-1